MLSYFILRRFQQCRYIQLFRERLSEKVHATIGPLPGCQKISIRGFPGFAPRTETSSRTQEKTSGSKGICPRVKFIILNIFSETDLYDYLKFPPKIVFMFREYYDAQLQFWLITF